MATPLLHLTSLSPKANLMHQEWKCWLYYNLEKVQIQLTVYTHLVEQKLRMGKQNRLTLSVHGGPGLCHVTLLPKAWMFVAKVHLPPDRRQHPWSTNANTHLLKRPSGFQMPPSFFTFM